MTLHEISEAIDRIERVKPLLTNLGDVAIQDRHLADLYARREALTGGERRG